MRPRPSRWRALALVCCCCLAAPVAWPLGARAADSLSQVFARGNRAFATGDYANAVREYELLIEAGIADPDVSFNLASAYGSLGRYGQAIRYFERTLRLAPGDEGAERGLEQARRALGERLAAQTGEALVTDRPPLVEAIFARVRAETLAFSLLLASWLASLCAVLLLVVRAESARLGLGITCGLTALLAVLSGLGLGVSTDWGRSLSRAVVTAPNAAVRSGPDDAAQSHGELHEGAMVRVLARQGSYVRVRSGPLEGYVQSAQVGEI